MRIVLKAFILAQGSAGGMAGGDKASVECSHCGRAVSIEDASLLEKRGSKGLWRYLCPACLDEMSVPQGYTLKRDLSFLRAGEPTSEPGGAGRMTRGGDAPVETGTAPTRSVGLVEQQGQGHSSVIADFMGEVVTEATPGGRLVPARILMDRERLVLATDAGRIAVPLSTVVDVVPHDPAAEEGDAALVTLSYRTEDEVTVAFVGGPVETLDRFTTILFKALLSGTSVRFRHPARVGGRPREPPVQSGTVHLRGTTLRVDGTEASIEIPLDRVVTVSRRPAGWTDGDVPVLAVGYAAMDGTRVTEFAHPAERIARLLRRLCNLEHGRRRGALEAGALAGVEGDALVALYALGSETDLTAVLDGAPDVEDLLDGLVDAGLVRDTEAGPQLTMAGRAEVHRRFQAAPDASTGP